MTLYSIQDTTLTGIADALRGKLGDTKTITMTDTRPVQLKKVSKTPNATGFDTHNGGYGNKQQFYDVVTLPGATSIKIKMAYQSENTRYDFVQVAAGNLTAMPSDATKYGNNILTTTELLFEDTDTVTFYFYSDTSNDSYLGYYAECHGLDENGDIVFVDEEITWEEEVLNTFKPEEMAASIDSLKLADPSCTGLHIPEEGLIVKGYCYYKFAYDSMNWYLDTVGDKIITYNITNAGHMFYDNDGITSIPFDINFIAGGAQCNNMFAGCDNLETVPAIDFKQSSYKDCATMFQNCAALKEIGTLSNLYPSSMQSMFANCTSLRYLPEFENLNMDRMYTAVTANMSSMFNGCYSLRSIPEDFLKKLKKPSSTSYIYTIFSSSFYNCVALDEIRGLNPQTGTITSNMFGSTFYNCHRLKEVIFALQEDGTPYSVNWSNQTIDLTPWVGYIVVTSLLLDSNSGITADKEVKDDATYQALKNDPDWWTTDMAYNRYNHDSAVNTINSLPDATQGSGNTIKFKGVAGSATDGGAINTLTEEEIAVAAAKGWTVTFA